jgi:predicted secreted protein
LTETDQENGPFSRGWRKSSAQWNRLPADFYERRVMSIAEALGAVESASSRFLRTSCDVDGGSHRRSGIGFQPISSNVVRCRWREPSAQWNRLPADFFERRVMSMAGALGAVESASSRFLRTSCDVDGGSHRRSGIGFQPISTNVV